LPSFLCHIRVRKTVVSALVPTNVTFARLGPFNVETVECVSWGELFLYQRLTSFDIVNDHGISDEFGNLRGHIGEAGELVHWIERVGRLPGRDELLNLSLGPLDVCISQVVLWLVQAYMQHSWPRTLDVFI